MLAELFQKATEHFGKLPEIVFTTVAILDEFNWEKCVDINIVRRQINRLGNHRWRINRVLSSWNASHLPLVMTDRRCSHYPTQSDFSRPLIVIRRIAR